MRIGVRWHTGATEQLTAARAVHPGTAKRSPTAAIDLVKRLGPTTSNEELVTQLSTAGLRTGHGRPFDIAAVQWIRHAYKIPTPDPFAAGEISVAEAAHRVGCSTGVLYHCDPHRATGRSPRLGQPILHPLERPDPRRLPVLDRPVRPPGPHRPAPKASRLTFSRRRRRGQRHRGRLPAGLQHRRPLLLDRNRPAHGPPRPGQLD